MSGERLPHFLGTEHVTLRAVEPYDAALIGRLVERNLEHLRPWMPWAAHEPVSPQQRKARLEEVCRAREAGTQYEYLVARRGEEPVGKIGAHRRVGPGGIELGYWLDAEAQGQGTMTEAALALTHAALALGDVHRVEIHAAPDNHRSLAIPRRLGFTREGVLRAREQLADGTWGDTESWCLVEGDPLLPNPLLSA